MSILITLEAMPNRMRALAEVVASELEMEKDELARRVVPGAEKTDQFVSLLRETIRLGVLVENKESKSVAINASLTKKQITNPADFLAFCRTCLIPEGEGGGEGNEAFSRALAWLLTRPIGPSLEAGSEFQSQLLKDLNGGEIYELTNSSRSSMLVYWAQALGFVEWLKFDGKDYCNPDPTRALAVTFREVLEKKHQTPINEVLEKVGRAVPVFETGRVRKEVEGRMKVPRDPNYISQSTSLAILRLKANNTIKIEHLADAPTLLMSTLDNQDEPVSHITLLKS